jgi:prolipoprotein diacylglyceryltransferase
MQQTNLFADVARQLNETTFYWCIFVFSLCLCRVGAVFICLFVVVIYSFAEGTFRQAIEDSKTTKIMQYSYRGARP